MSKTKRPIDPPSGSKRRITRQASQSLPTSLDSLSLDLPSQTDSAITFSPKVMEPQAPPYNENLLSRARVQWQKGDWESLVGIEGETLQEHPDRAKLSLLVASGYLQLGNISSARHYTRLALEWGCTKSLVCRFLIAGVHNTLGRAAAIGGQGHRAIRNFEASISIGTPGNGLRLIVDSRIGEQFAQIGLSRGSAVENFSQKPTISISKYSTPFDGLMYELKPDAMSEAPTHQNTLLKDKTILILLWFRNLAGGGLHEHVRDAVDAIISAGGSVVVVCPKSSLSADLSKRGIVVVESDYDDPKLAGKIIRSHKINLIHAHPGPSRNLAIGIKNILDVPVFFTVHGGWFDSIDDHFDEVTQVICVSEYICQLLREKKPLARSKIIMIPNGVDDEVFNSNFEYLNKRNYAVFSGRLDNDKLAGLELMKKCWVKIARGELPFFKWYIAGDGPLLEELKLYAQETFNGDGGHVEFLGWLDRKSLADLLKDASVSISGGRCCLEALACGCFSIAIAAGKPWVINDFRSFREAAYSNFGGFGSGGGGDDENAIFDALGKIFQGDRGSQIDIEITNFIQENLTKKAVSQRLVQLYISEINRSD